MSGADAARPQSTRNGNDSGSSFLHALRGWFRLPRRKRNGEHLRDAIEELIEEDESKVDETDGDERRLLKNILELHDLTVEDIMVPRADIVAIEEKATLGELMALVSGSAHSRLPVYRGNLDDVVGMVHIRDVLNCVHEGENFRLADILHEILVVVPSMRVLDLLLEMRTTRRHMAAVVDEFGGVDGLATIEDLVEEIVGEIEDEHDLEEGPRLIEDKDGTLTADARTTIEEFEERFGQVFTVEEREDIETLGGLIFVLAGRVPARGELISHPSGLEFEVVEADPRKVKRLRVRGLSRETTRSP